jgi:hypothetical protein
LPDRFSNGLPTRESSVFYPRPWLGGVWTIRNAIDYMLTADFAILDTAASRPAEWLMKSYHLARASIEAGQRGGPFAYVVPPAQWDRPVAVDMLERLHYAGIQLRQARAPFQADGNKYPEGTYVILAGQPFRPYLVDLMEPQRYPELRSGQSGPVKRPYDIAGWTLPMQMGVRVDRVETPFEANLVPVDQPKYDGAVLGAGPAVTLDHHENAVFQAINFFLGRQEKVYFSDDGTIYTDSPYVENPGRAANFARQFGITVRLAAEPPEKLLYELKPPRVAVYEPWIPNADAGWTQFVLDQFGVEHTVLHNSDFRAPDLAKRFDAIVIAQQSASSILHGFRSGEFANASGGDPALRPVAVQRPNYAGGIGIAGLARLEEFVREGGTLITLDTASELPLQFFPLPVRNVARDSAFYAPGSLLRMSVDPTNPIAFGMPREIIALSTGGTAFEPSLAPAYNKGDRQILSVVRFASRNLLASGWASGEQSVLGKHALLDVRYGKGHVVLFGFRPQFRGQPHGTFKLLLNAIYLASAQKLQ